MTVRREQEVSTADVAKAKPRTSAQVEASRVNLQKSSGCPRKPFNFERVNGMRAEGKTQEQIAAALGVSRWTLRRRQKEEQELKEML